MNLINRRRILILSLIGLILLIYYQLDYKRHFIHNKDKTEYLTIWQRLGYDCYIIPGKYNGIIHPKKNYIKTTNYRNYIGIIWNTSDNFNYKISIYNEYQLHDLNSDVKVYPKNDSLLLEFQILDTLDVQRGKRIKNDSADYYMKKSNYNYVDLNRIIGIKTYKY